MKFIHIIATFMLLTYCSTYPISEDDGGTIDKETNDVPCSINIVLDNPNRFKLYQPLFVYVFDTEGNLYQEQEIGTLDEIQLTLPKGSYRITLLSGLDKAYFDYPIDMTEITYLKLKSKAGLPSPLLYASSSISVSKNMRLHMEIHYLVSCFSFSFSDVPTDVSALRVEISPLSSGFSMNGELMTSAYTLSIDCNRIDRIWKMDPVYVLPTEGNHVNISVVLVRNNTEEYYSYIYNYKLSAGEPYTFDGEYTNTGIRLTPNFTIDKWEIVHRDTIPLSEMKPADNLPVVDDGNPGSDNNYPILPEKSNQITGTLLADGRTLMVDRLPTSGDFYDRCLIWNVVNESPSSANALLIAPDNLKCKAGAGIEKAQLYRGLDIAGWRVMTKQEAQAFIEWFVDDYQTLFDLLSDAGAEPFYRVSSDDRYLCNDCLSSFSLLSNRITTVGTSREYYLRPVYKIQFKLK